MKTFYSLNEFLKSRRFPKKLVLTIGVFDGVHRAHQKIIRALVKRASSHALSSALITFDPHPVNVLHSPGKVPLLISFRHRLRLLEGMGLDYVIALRFNERLSRMSAADFIRRILGRFPISEIIVGKNFFFGKNKKGSLKDFKKFSGIYGYRVSVIPAIKASGKVISSTRIRNLVLNGALEKASKLLSRPVTVLGTVAKGYGRGRIIGYPTANIDPHHEAIPPSGVYAVRIKLHNRLHKGVLNIGTKPTFAKDASGRKEPTVEAHIFDFDNVIYGMDIEIEFIKKIRNERRFKDMHKLRQRIEKDEQYARRLLR